MIDGADGETRTRTALRHYPLKIACLPISPRRHYENSTGPEGEKQTGRTTTINEAFRQTFCYFGMSLAFESPASPPATCGAAGAIAPPDSPEVEAGDSTTFCITPPTVFGCFAAKYAKVKLVMKNTVARTAVVRERKLADPVAPKRLPDAPLPNAAPMSAPLPCCRRTRPMIATATIRCTTNAIENKKSMKYSKTPLGACRFADRQKLGRYQRSAAHQPAIDIRQGKQLGSI